MRSFMIVQILQINNLYLVILTIEFIKVLYYYISIK